MALQQRRSFSAVAVLVALQTVTPFEFPKIPNVFGGNGGFDLPMAAPSKITQVNRSMHALSYRGSAHCTRRRAHSQTETCPVPFLLPFLLIHSNFCIGTAKGRSAEGRVLYEQRKIGNGGKAERSAGHCERNGGRSTHRIRPVQQPQEVGPFGRDVVSPIHVS